VNFALPPVSAERRLLPEGRLAGPMPWVIAIMMFLMVLAAAAGLGLGHAAHGLGSDLANRLTVQIVEANPDARERQARVAVATLGRLPGIKSARRVDDAEMKRLLEPWLGEGATDGELPLPAMIDVMLDGGSAQEVSAALRGIAPGARVDDHAQTLAPLGRLIAALRWLSVALVLLMAAATACAVVLAARAALNTHRATIDVMHLLGATDIQIARLFQRRIAIDALLGGCVGFVVAGGVLLLLGQQLEALGSELLGSVALPWQAWIALLTLPLVGVMLATLTARWTVLTTLRKIL
jgi:cell division transport system permease protein